MTGQRNRTRISWGGKDYGGFGVGIWKGIYGSQVIWSIALGPATLYVSRDRSRKAADWVKAAADEAGSGDDGNA